ncbi:MAG: hypothetical protein FJ088_08795, partial [Deltaproteobacteria bacterium]|nr:hypothetical protein [Deltaproteobacteria bacterium]
PNLVKPGVKHLDELSKLVLKATAKEPKHRPTDVTELMEAIAALQGALFPDLDLSVEPAREVGVVVNYKPEMDEEVREAAKVVDFKGHEEPAPAPREEPEKKEEKPRETMVFTGLVERIKEVEEELLKQQKKSAVEESPQEEIKTHMMQAVPGETAEKKIKPSEDWFVEDSGSLAEVEGEGEASYGTKKDSKTFFIIVGAVSILVIIALAIYLDNKSGKSVLDEIQKKPPRIDTLSENRVVMSPAPQDVAVAQEISTTPAAMAETAVEKPSAAAEEVKHVEAAAAAEEKTEPAQIKTAAVEKPEKNPEPVPEEKKPEIKPEEKPPVEKPFVKTEPKPAVKKDKPPRPKEQAPMTEEEKLNLIKQTLTQARAEYDKKNFKKAIDLSNKVLKLQPDNKLAAKLLEQSKAGMQ